jgi:DNA polymerase-3 subunit gamma/tau
VSPRPASGPTTNNESGLAEFASRGRSSPERPSTPMQRAMAAVAQEASTRHTSSSSSLAADSMVSADDENIDEAGSVGQPVIARVLGGTVIPNLDR